MTKQILLIIYVTRHNKTGQLSVTKKKWYSFYLKEHFIISKMIPLMCKLDAALQFYGKK